MAIRSPRLTRGARCVPVRQWRRHVLTSSGGKHVGASRSGKMRHEMRAERVVKHHSSGGPVTAAVAPGAAAEPIRRRMPPDRHDGRALGGTNPRAQPAARACASASQARVAHWMREGNSRVPSSARPGRRAWRDWPRRARATCAARHRWRAPPRSCRPRPSWPAATPRRWRSRSRHPRTPLRRCGRPRGAGAA